MDWIQRVKNLIERHEGRERFPYKDSREILTIGVGRNLEANGLSDQEIDFLLENDVRKATVALSRSVSAYRKLDPVRKAVLVDMAFNLGINGLLKFKNFISALERQDWIEAGCQMEDSRWWKQVKTRGPRLRRMIETGEWP